MHRGVQATYTAAYHRIKVKIKKSLLRDNTGKNVDFYLFKSGGIPDTYTAVCHRNKS